MMNIHSISLKRRGARMLLNNKAFIVIILLFAAESFFVPKFLTATNLTNVLRQISITGIVAVGVTFVIITAGIDISVGSIVAMGGIVAGIVLKSTGNVLLAFTAAMLVGAAAGIANGVLVAYARALPFVITLGSMYIFRGSALIMSNGMAIWGFDERFTDIGSGYFLRIPVPVLIMILVYLFAMWLLNKTKYGTYVKAIGGNEEAARRCGVDVKFYKMVTYGLSGLLSSFAGIILAARLGSSQPSVGSGYELIAIASAVIGGTSLLGGKGSLVGTLLGAIILGMLSNALNLLGVLPFYQTVITGTMVIIAVLIDSFRK